MDHPGAVAILVPDEKGRLLLVSQYREGARKGLWEIPAGTLEPDEDPEACARRELQEETGLKPESLRLLGVLYSTPGYSTEKIYVFLAEKVSGHAQASSEIDRVRFFAPFEILELAKKGEGDGKTLAALALFLLGESPKV